MAPGIPNGQPVVETTGTTPPTVCGTGGSGTRCTGWQIGQMSADDYVKTARQWAKVLKWTDPGIELVSCGQTGWTDWDQTVIAGLVEFATWHSLHIYTGHDDYWPNVLSPHQAEPAPFEYPWH